MNHVAVFDINETTLDLTPVRRAVDGLIGRSDAFTVWFQKLLQISMTSTATGDYLDFTALARSALHAVADACDRSLPPDAWDQVASAMGSLDAYRDVEPGLASLRTAGWSTVALTNSAPASVEAQLTRADLTQHFDHILSIDAVRAYKPAAAPYEYAAEQVGSVPSDMWMIACHDWDLAGARAVGMSTAFITRPGMSYAFTYPNPDLTASDFNDLADQLISQHQTRASPPI